MKYLEYPELEVLSRALTFEMSECKVFTRLEAYSCKAVNKEKRLFKNLESSYLLSASSSPPGYLDEALASPFGRLDQPSARKTLFLLIATLNGAFPDHDFSDVNPGDFIREASPTMVLNSLTSTLQSLKSGIVSPNSLGSLSHSLDDPVLPARSPMGSDTRSHAASSSHPLAASGSNARSANVSLSAVLDDIINITDCEVYSFHPDMDSDPHASAEPDEEGGEMDEGDPYDEGYSVDAGGVVSRGGTPMHHDVEMTDAPVFDEELMDGDFVPRRESGAGSMPHHTHTSSFSSTHSHDDVALDEDDLGGAGAGLLWSTFSFFYNRRMKRILFVSVWSRKNTPVAPPTWSSPSLAAVRPPPLPTWSVDIDQLPAQVSRALPHEQRGEHLLTPTASPAKTSARLRPHAGARRAVDVEPYPVSSQIRRHRRTARGRSASNSPAPSALSPFPHTQQPMPQALGLRTTSGAEPTSSFASLDATVLSASAPAIGRPPSQQLAGSPPVVKRTSGARNNSRPPPVPSHTKRTRV
ncbi:hypothetical protein MBRA1_001935 [Malassezia brasiliensis]|uniref:Maf1 regulator n=1 Tax=Malassezia brasiliensis TaxID=1821822 RepID=A0AAF0DTP9_9BASI|nr:hypothetical protein MBRA1_001935 [Malassezia brasiliensis]